MLSLNKTSTPSAHTVRTLLKAFSVGIIVLSVFHLGLAYQFLRIHATELLPRLGIDVAVQIERRLIEELVAGRSLTEAGQMVVRDLSLSYREPLIVLLNSEGTVRDYIGECPSPDPSFSVRDLSFVDAPTLGPVVELPSPCGDSRVLTSAARAHLGEPLVLLFYSVNSFAAEVASVGVIGFLLFLVLIVLVLAACAVFIAARLYRRLVSDARQLGEAAEQYLRGESGELHVRSETHELVQLSTALSDMLHEHSRRSFDIEADARARERMTGNILHDLRTPLTSIESSLEMLHRDTVDRVQYEEFIRSAVRTEAELAENLLALSHLDSHEHHEELRQISVADLLGDVATQIAVIAEKEGIKFEAQNIGSQEQLWVMPQLFRRAVLNLLSNAIRYTPEGGRVLLDYGIDGERLCSYVRVQDSGMGISKEQQAHVFDDFYRTEEAKARAPQGSGIGLALVKRVAELHGAELELESELERGSSFRILLPRHKSEGSAQTLPRLRLPRTPFLEHPLSREAAYFVQFLLSLIILGVANTLLVKILAAGVAITLLLFRARLSQEGQGLVLSTIVPLFWACAIPFETSKAADMFMGAATASLGHLFAERIPGIFRFLGLAALVLGPSLLTEGRESLYLIGSAVGLTFALTALLVDGFPLFRRLGPQFAAVTFMFVLLAVSLQVGALWFYSYRIYSQALRPGLEALLEHSVAQIEAAEMDTPQIEAFLSERTFLFPFADWWFFERGVTLRIGPLLSTLEQPKFGLSMERGAAAMLVPESALGRSRSIRAGATRLAMPLCMDYQCTEPSVLMLQAPSAEADHHRGRYLQPKVAVLGVLLTFVSYLVLFAVAIFIHVRLRPKFRRVQQCLAAYSRGDYQEKIADTSEDAIGKLCAILDRLAHELPLLEQRAEQLRADTTQFIARIGKELQQTSGRIGRLLDQDGLTTAEARRRFEREAEQQRVLLESLFEYLRLKQGALAIEGELLPLTEFVSEVFDRVEPQFCKRELHVRAQLSDDECIAYTSPNYFPRALESMLLGLMRASRPDDEVSLILRAEGSAVTLVIAHRGLTSNSAELSALRQQLEGAADAAASRYFDGYLLAAWSLVHRACGGQSRLDTTNGIELCFSFRRSADTDEGARYVEI